MSQSEPAPTSPRNAFDEDTIVTGVRYVTPYEDGQERDTDLMPETGPDDETTAVMKDMSGMVREALASRPLPVVVEPEGGIDFSRILSTDPDDDQDPGFPIDLDDEGLDDERDK